MKTLLLLTLLAFALPTGWSQTPAVTTFARLGGTPDGYHPAGALIDGGDGAFYGVTEAGGPANCGTVYRLAPDGTYATLHTFSGQDGANPLAALVHGVDGFFYGTTSGGGAANSGTVFKISAVGAFTSLASFGALDNSFHNANGAHPQAALVSGGDGSFYGTATDGGAGGNGTIFGVSPAGALSVVYTFTTYANGTQPKSALTLGGDGALYGVTPSGGTGSGVIFRVPPTSSYQVLYTFTNGAEGGNPSSALVLSGGTFFGLTNKAFFSVTPAGAVSVLHPFDPATEGAIVSGGLVAGGGNFYGVSALQGTGEYGMLFALSPGGAFTLLHAFGNTGDGAYPSAPPVLGADGNLYGIAAGGFNGNFINGGAIYRATPGTGELTTVHPFAAGAAHSAAGLLQAADGNFYGTTAQGGAKDAGTVFGADSDGVSTATLHEFDPDTEGSRPQAALLEAPDGTFYGTASADGPGGGGTLFQLAPVSTTSQTPSHGAIPRSSTYSRVLGLSVKAAFKGQGVGPFTAKEVVFLSIISPPPTGSVFRKDAAAPSIFGILQSGGDSSGGGLYSSTLDGAVTYLHPFGGGTTDGALPEGLTKGADGNLYGVTYGGGSATVGTIFQLTPAGAYRTLYSFKGTGDGAFPQAGLTAGADGNLYGVTQHGVYNDASTLQGNGTIFSISPTGTFTTLHILANDSSEGSQPMAALLQASDGKFYGTTSDGVVFSVTAGGQYTKLATLDGRNGAGSVPVAPMIEGIDGNLYGTTSAGGTDNAGVIYRVNPSLIVPPAPPTVTVAVKGSALAYEGGAKAKLLLTRTGGDESKDLTVYFKLKGSAQNGVAYQLLPTSATIPAGAASVKVKIKPIEDTLENGNRTAALKIVDSPTGDYLVGPPKKATVTIIDDD